MFSIIICTYNPNLEILQRLLNAVLLFDNEVAHEVIIVDNNSNPKLAEVAVIRQFLETKKGSILIEESIPGLTSARIAGIKKAKYDWLIFFDDDNEPEVDYLVSTQNTIGKYPQVFAWGPGRVEVIFLRENLPLWLNDYKNLFQERNNKQIEFDNNLWWQNCYPFGTGLAVRKEICFEYLRNVESRIYSLTDRKGTSLSSGGDLQIVYTGLKMNLSAGVSPLIKIKHLISPDKTTIRYIAKLYQGGASSNLPAYYQCFPERYSHAKHKLPTKKETVRKLYYLAKVVGFNKGFREFYFGLARYIGEINGIASLNNTRPNWIIRYLESQFSFK